MGKGYTPQEVAFIQARACERIIEIFDALGCEYVERHDYIQLACPVHGGDNSRAVFWAIRSNHWECKTRNCHKEQISGPSNSVFGLIRGTIQHRTGKPCSFQQAVHFAAQALGLKNIHVDAQTAQDIEMSKVMGQYRRKKTPVKNKGILLRDIIEHLTPDTVYYPNRGVSRDIIAKYHISFCDTPKKPLYKRAFFPILDETGKYVVGWSGRSIYGECGKCKMHHHPDRQLCPDRKYAHLFAKWRHSTNMRAESCLYNLWYAKPFISRTGTAILCEGPGDVWALESAGIHNGVALLGLNLSNHQRLMLQNAGALTIICAFDNDEAGMAATKKIQKELNHYFRIFCATPNNAKDIGEMDSENIMDGIGSILQKVSMTKILSDGYGRRGTCNDGV